MLNQSTSNCEKMARSKENQKLLKVTQQFLNREPRTNIQVILIKRSSSKQEHKENALASGAEERRDKLR